MQYVNKIHSTFPPGYRLYKWQVSLDQIKKGKGLQELHFLSFIVAHDGFMASA